MAKFTPEERSRIAYHLGYADMSSVASLAAGLMGTLVLSPLLDKQLELLNPASRTRVLQLCDDADTCENQQRKLAKDARATQLGSMRLNPNARRELTAQYDEWVTRLAQVTQCPRNPEDARLLRPNVGSVNGRWAR